MLIFGGFPNTEPHRKRCRHYNEPGHAHALTFSCFRRQPFLSRDRTRLWVLDAMRLAREKHSIDLWAYVIMPEHIHWLLWPRLEGYAISAVLKTFKESVSKRAILFVRREAPHFLKSMTDRQPNGKEAIRFWQRGGGYDRNVWEASSLWKMIDYIHANPVRRGLCQRAEDWPWSSASEYAGKRDGLLAMDRASLPADPRG